jgi:hypothetical protein
MLPGFRSLPCQLHVNLPSPAILRAILERRPTEGMAPSTQMALVSVRWARSDPAPPTRPVQVSASRFTEDEADFPAARGDYLLAFRLCKLPLSLALHVL